MVADAMFCIAIGLAFYFEYFVSPGAVTQYAPFIILAAIGGTQIISLVCIAIIHRMPPIGRCPECGYDLRGATHNRCPECGVAIQRF
jgi:tRNA(Ile2) C34 agmatinyltransferase TiaS